MEGDEEYIQASRGKSVESFTCSDQPQNPPKKKKNKMMENNKRRFSDEQIRSLECIFESESKLEPKKKLQLAKDLGLQPRQVAIWFQNRRARWKSKRIEQDYRKLRDEYENLASRFESLSKEKESLQLELQKLSDMMEISHDDGRRELGKVAKECSTDDGGSGSGYNNCRAEAKTGFLYEGLEDKEAMQSEYQNENSRRTKKPENRGLQQFPGMDENVEIPLASSFEKWYSVDPSSILDQSCTSSVQWPDFWT